MKKKSKNKIVASPSHLIKLIEDGQRDFALLLNGGVFSRKTIMYSPRSKKFHITNHIDDSNQILSEAQLMDQSYTNIGLGITRNSLIAIID